jgi:hypothetical protein
MRKLVVLIILAPLFAACASTGPAAPTRADVPPVARLVRLYSMPAPNVYLDWKYSAGHDDKAVIAEVVLGTISVRSRPTGDLRQDAQASVESISTRTSAAR